MALKEPGNGCVWIIGASSGIGAELAKRLCSMGYRVAISARSKEKLDDLVASQSSDRMHAYLLDVTDGDAPATALAEIEAGLGPVHTAVYCAGTYKALPADAFDAGEARKQINVNLIGAINTFDPLLSAMLGRGDGKIALVSSLTSRFGLPQASVYGATKAALLNLAEGLRVECQGRGVTIQVINPGFVETPLTEQNDFDMPFLINTEKAVDAILHGLKSNRFETAFPWQMDLATRLLRFLPRSVAFAITRRMVR